MVIASFPKDVSIPKVVNELDNNGIKTFDYSRQRIHFVTHYGINEDDIQYSINRIEKVLLNYF